MTLSINQKIFGKNHMSFKLDIENLERVLTMQNECYFESYVGTDNEDLDVTEERLEEIFTHQPDKSLMTTKEYIATLKECENALREM